MMQLHYLLAKFIFIPDGWMKVTLENCITVLSLAKRWLEPVIWNNLHCCCPIVMRHPRLWGKWKMEIHQSKTARSVTNEGYCPFVLRLMILERDRVGRASRGRGDVMMETRRVYCCSCHVPFQRRVMPSSIVCVNSFAYDGTGIPVAKKFDAYVDSDFTGHT